MTDDNTGDEWHDVTIEWEDGEITKATIDGEEYDPDDMLPLSAYRPTRQQRKLLLGSGSRNNYFGVPKPIDADDLRDMAHLPDLGERIETPAHDCIMRREFDTLASKAGHDVECDEFTFDTTRDATEKLRNAGYADGRCRWLLSDTTRDDLSKSGDEFHGHGAHFLSCAGHIVRSSNAYPDDTAVFYDPDALGTYMGRVIVHDPSGVVRVSIDRGEE